MESFWGSSDLAIKGVSGCGSGGRFLCFCIFAALPPFLRRVGVVVKGRRPENVHCWGCEWVVRVDEACLGEVVSWAVLVMEVLGMGVYT